MKKFLLLLLIISAYQVKGQGTLPRIVDSVSNKPLAYAIVIYNNKQQVMYTDINGYFNLSADSLKPKDTVIIQYLGYKKQAIPVNKFSKGLVIKMIADAQQLQPVVVSNCPRFESYTLNRRKGVVRQYVGPGPETRLVIISRYYNTTGRNAYLEKLSLLFDEKLANLQIPVRLRWYEWDNDNRMPGKELTDTSIIVYPYKSGWNDFDVPERTIAFPKDWVVFGFEFIYPPEYAEQFKALQGSDAKLKWLNDFGHRWSLSMQYAENEDEGAFYIINNDAIEKYNKKFEKYYMRPAARFTISYCRD